MKLNNDLNNGIKKLYRSRTNRVVAGVCGGLGDYFGTDPIFFRAIFLLLVLFSGIGVLLYIIMAILTPQEGDPEGTVSGQQ